VEDLCHDDCAAALPRELPDAGMRRGVEKELSSFHLDNDEDYIVINAKKLN
jgi:hypothetical protein